MGIKIGMSRIKRAIKRTKYPCRGCTARYVRIDDKWGVKLYWSKHHAEHLHKKHESFHNQGVGPQVGRQVTLKYGYENEYKYGFIIEHCRVPYDDKTYSNAQAYHDCIELKKRLEERGIEWVDNGDYNWGLNQAGEPVVIDVGCGGQNEC
jgi:hypothetical protein